MTYRLAESAEPTVLAVSVREEVRPPDRLVV